MVLVCNFKGVGVSVSFLNIGINLPEGTHHKWPRKLTVSSTHRVHPSKVYFATKGILINLFSGLV